MSSFVLDRDEEIEETLYRCARSLKAHCLQFHRERFTRPFTRRHEMVFEAYDDPSVRKILVIAHRGFGKSTFFNWAIPSHRVVHQLSKFIVPVSESSTQAVMQSEALKSELLQNPFIKFTIGDIRNDELFSKEAWTTPRGQIVLPRGRGQQLRGLSFDRQGIRPDCFVIDDLEDAVEVQNPDLRVKTKRWFFSDLLNTVDRALDIWRAFMIGTVLHEDSLIEHIRGDKTWTVFDLPLCDENYKSYDTFFMSDAKVLELVEEHRSQGILDVFYMEYMNQCIAREDAVFQADMFRYYNEGELDLSNDPSVDNVVIVDPARTIKVHSDPTAIVGVGINPSKQAIYCRDIVRRRMRPDEIYSEIFDMMERINAKVLGVEDNGLNEFILQPLKNEMARRGKVYEIVVLKPRRPTGSGFGTNIDMRGKGRIGALAPYYRMGKVFHNPSCCGVLESELLAFPKSKHDDVSDAFAYIVQMLEAGERYFEEELSEEEASRFEDEYWEDPSEIEREYHDLVNDEPELCWVDDV